MAEDVFTNSSNQVESCEQRNYKVRILASRRCCLSLSRQHIQVMSVVLERSISLAAFLGEFPDKTPRDATSRKKINSLGGG